MGVPTALSGISASSFRALTADKISRTRLASDAIWSVPMGLESLVSIQFIPLAVGIPSALVLSMSPQTHESVLPADSGVTLDVVTEVRRRESLLKTGALQNAIFNSANFSSIATDEKGVIQLFNVGAERMLGYTAAEVVDKITPADISDPQEVIARAKTLSLELSTAITPGFEALAFKASRGIEDIYELTYIRKDGSRFPAVVSVTALRDDQDTIIGYLLIGTDNTARKQVEAEQKQLDQRLRDQQFYTRSLIESNIDALMTTDPRGIITDVNKQMEALTGCTRDELIGAPFKDYFHRSGAGRSGHHAGTERKEGHRLRTHRAGQGQQGNRGLLQCDYFLRSCQDAAGRIRRGARRHRAKTDRACAAGKERGAGNREVHGGKSQPGEIRLPFQHEP